MNGRCCAKCKNPHIGCALKSCKCHGSNIDAEIISIMDYLEDR